MQSECPMIMTHHPSWKLSFLRTFGMPYLKIDWGKLARALGKESKYSVSRGTSESHTSMDVLRKVQTFVYFRNKCSAHTLAIIINVCGPTFWVTQKAKML